MPWSRTGTADPRDRAGAGPRPYADGPTPRIIAHRGLALDGAENTLRAFGAALEAGADVIETDAHVTADGVAVAMHDPDLSRVTGEHGSVARVTAGDLAQLRVAGAEPIPSLEEVLDAVPAPVNIDVKVPAAALPVARAIARTASADRVCVTSFDGRTAAVAARAVLRLTGTAPRRSPSQGIMTAFVLALAAGAPQGAITRLLRPYAALQIPPRHRGHPLVTPRSVAAAHRAGCEVHVWTIDTEREMRDLLAMGADGIVTNRSDVLARVLGRAGSM